MTPQAAREPHPCLGPEDAPLSGTARLLSTANAGLARAAALVNAAEWPWRHERPLAKTAAHDFGVFPQCTTPSAL
ncbi:MAG: hypothetical protein ACRC20_05155 [Segniliparus sp.]|uniref:hypothetical protein n=1 Tax=Segniliparus sp. TaxID=2804064 RepID=UPI003F35B4C8